MCQIGNNENTLIEFFTDVYRSQIQNGLRPVEAQNVYITPQLFDEMSQMLDGKSQLLDAIKTLSKAGYIFVPTNGYEPETNITSVKLMPEHFAIS
ncbi:hypothetical protein [Levilactobacillus bambusae]|uniref:Uncharacterized protein n=1 Tax=Levilactobacillus bambusae TaxID=2024736 RepID=A0A2V1N1D5_9LACO|nr:hypothetical protein [Levilactobacillus bambusae]PWG01101.1 hypothetical protein DCM90_02695 [Levilactobacillus bambusae]